MGRMIVGFEGLVVPERVRRMADAGLLAGVVLFARNVESSAQWATLIAEIDGLFPGDGPPPIIAVDQEGGPVQRLKPPAIPEATAIPAMATLAAKLDEAGFETLGAAMGAELGALGVNVDFAPVLDVDTNPDNPIIGWRAFGKTPEDVIARGLAFARGLEDAQIAWCAKHFPGHGDTLVDSHLTLPRLTHGLERLVAIELAPFEAAALAGAPMIMTAHVVFEVLDAVHPATLSPHVVPALLRERFGYDGVVISDDLDMLAIRDNYNVIEVANGLAAADIDIPLVCHDLDFAWALASVLVPSARSDERVLALRSRLVRSRIATMPPFPAELRERIG